MIANIIIQTTMPKPFLILGVLFVRRYLNKLIPTKLRILMKQVKKSKVYYVRSSKNLISNEDISRNYICVVC